MSRGIFRISGAIATRWGGQGAIPFLLGLLLLLAAGPARAQTVIDVGTASELVTALTTVDTTPGTYTINITTNITLDAGTTLPAITGSANNVTINGGPGITLDGAGLQRGFFVYQGTVAINDLTIQNTVAQGGAGGDGVPGGGGAGLGGALFVASGASLSVSGVTLTGNSALGGAGGSAVSVFGGGGGGMGGNGGTGGGGEMGGGGGLGLGANGGSNNGSGAAGIVRGAAGGGAGEGGGSGGGRGGGGGSGFMAGGGGVAGGSGGDFDGGVGGLGGGGGGAIFSSSVGGAGGLGGGGGGSGGGTGGAGGFGGGGGGAGLASSAVGGLGGFGGGNGGVGTTNSGGGGGGLGAGGAIFVQQGGIFTVDGPLTINGNSVTAGLGGTGIGDGSNGTPGAAIGTGMFLQGTGTVTFSPGAGQSQTISNVIADEAGNGGSAGNAWTLRKTGSGTLTLAAANTYSGGTTITGGLIGFSAANNFGTGQITLDGGGLLWTSGNFTDISARLAPLGSSGGVFDTNGNNEFFGTALSGSGGLTLADSNAAPGRLELSGTNSYTGGTTVNSGTLFMQSGATLASTGTLTVNGGSFNLNGNTQTVGTLSGSGGGIELGSGGALTVTQATNIGYAGAISGNGSLTKTGAGTLTLTGNNNYQGGTTVSAGTLAGTTAGLQGNIFVANGANVSFDQALGTQGGYGGQLSGDGSLTKTGAGMLFLTNTNSYSGGTVVAQGGLSIGSDANLGNGGTVALAANTTLQFTNSGTYTHAITVSGDPIFSLISSLTVTQSGAIADGGTPGTVEVTGGGTLVLTNTANSYSGGTVVTDESTVSIADDHVLGAVGGRLTLGDGTFSGKLAITDSLASARAITLAAGGGTITPDAGVAATLEGNITGAGGLTKAGDGTLVLAGVNDYAGGTTIEAGTLQGNTTSLQGDTDMTGTASLVFEQDFTGTYAGDISGGRGSLTKLGTGKVILTGTNSYGFGTTVSGGILQGDTDSLQRSIVDNANVTFDQAADGSFSGNISGSGSLTKTGAGTLVFNSNNNYSGGTTIEDGLLQIGDANNQVSFAGAVVANGGSGFDLVHANTGAITSITANDSAAIRFYDSTTASSAVIVINDSATTSFASGSDAGSAHLTTNDGGSLRFLGSAASAVIVTNDHAATTFVDSGSAGSASITTNDTATTTFAFTSTAGTASITTNDSAFTFFQNDSTAGGATLTTNDKATVQFLGTSDAGTATILNDKGGLSFFEISTANLAHITNENGGTTAFVNDSSAGAAVILSGSNGSLTFYDASKAENASITNESGGSTAFTETSTAASAIIVNNGSLAFFDTTTAASAGISTNDGGDTAFRDHSTAGSASLITNSGGTARFLDDSSAGTANIFTNSGGTIIFGDSSSAASATLTTLDGGSTEFTGSSSGGEARFVTSTGGEVVFGGLTTSGTTAGSIEGSGRYRLGAEQLTVGSNNLSTEVSGVISGNGGSLVKVGTGTLTLSGADTYGGGTTVNAGILRLGTGGSLDSSGPLTMTGGSFDLNGISQTVGALSGTGGTITLGNGTLTVKQSITTSFLGDISGTGGLTKAGPGTLILNGVNDYTGLTSVNSGVLEIGDADHTDASIAGPVTIGADGKLEGHGTIGGDVANTAGGVLSPGGSIGILTVGGNYNQGSTSRLLIEVSPTASSQLHVLGNASLAGNLALIYQPGVYSDASYDILNAASVTGTFGSVTGQTPSGFTQSVTYSPTDVTLDLASGGGPIVVTPTNDTIFTALSTAALLAAQQANGALLTHMGELHLGTGSPKVQTALAATTPTQVAFAGTADQLADLLPAIPQAVGQMGGWFKAIGSFASLDGSISTPGFDTQAGGFLAGFDKAFSPNLMGGIALGYLHTNLSEAGGASGSLDTPRLAVYGTYTLGDFAIDATAGYAYDFINSSRPFATLGQTASSSYNGQEANAALQVSTRANFAGITFMPAAGLAFVHVAQNGVSESGAPGFNLSVNGNSANSLRPFVGLTAAKSYTTDGGMVITPEADIAYSYETLNTTPPSLIQVGGGSFTVPGLMPSRSQLIIGGGITAQLTDTLALEAAYHITPPTGNTLIQTISIGLDYRF